MTTRCQKRRDDSARGSAKQGRNRNYLAILPLRVKILNVERARLDKILSNEEIRTIIAAIGTGIDEDEVSLKNARYGKVTIMKTPMSTARTYAHSC